MMSDAKNKSQKFPPKKGYKKNIETSIVNIRTAKRKAMHFNNYATNKASFKCVLKYIFQIFKQKF